MLPWLFLAFAGCFVLERWHPGWRLPRCGFDPEREESLLPMLAFADVHAET